MELSTYKDIFQDYYDNEFLTQTESQQESDKQYFTESANIIDYVLVEPIIKHFNKTKTDTQLLTLSSNSENATAQWCTMKSNDDYAVLMQQCHKDLYNYVEDEYVTEQMIEYAQKRLDVFVENVECSICYEMTTCRDVYTSDCNHVFHSSCMDKWCNLNYQCPLCKFDLHYYVGGKTR